MRRVSLLVPMTMLFGCAAQQAVAPGNIAADPIEWYQPKDAGLAQSLRPNTPSIEHAQVFTPEQKAEMQRKANDLPNQMGHYEH
jgi:hypothetical protein